METVITPSKARANLFSLIKDTNRDSKPVLIAGTDDDRSAVLIGKKNYDALQETMALIMNGQLQDAKNRENDESVDLDDMIHNIDNE
ncbi:putative Antitoxin of toxin-antitoxin stability system [Oenococcus oeni]|uniref:type II toxin-antitoxin system Phd/YefM family antitoxin n=1 Tax=Oenococcus oeni TaxID=1247 RepID=UPI00107D6620|nr:type II toxin-antitoxin system prevent-host-death family antitoxin [Oenococcus oeni]AVI94945.1 prevent-host-death family protein [Oenococcus oeni]SYV98570.1 putative Antitoxin of toxin-antitoxin stability system [Oenococcus oeni]SYW04532.1 putative Antitoxin of toxin-antitoxin stability system [Oenococcus oeni]SYW19031.1 putative Antitoxin of toxin-antitoxin stability system [Oenococcus oeni]VDC15588.1 putative Antitoxin of toxin-antitoxin stability system [Oenococcus oeni]